MTASEEIIARARSAFQRAFNTEPDFFTYAPGRVNLIGEHTDYNDGFVLPMAISYGTVIAAGRSSNHAIHAVAADYDDSYDLIDLNGTLSRRDDLPWTDHLRGVAHTFQMQGHSLSGINLTISGDIPKGAGLSSSASLGVALGLAFIESEGDQLTPVELAMIAQKSETDFVGTTCAIMDQLVSASATQGKALLIDCRSLETTAIPIPDNSAVLIIHSGVERELADSKYNERREQCEAVALHFGVGALRDLNLEQLIEGKEQIDDIAFRRARHVITENIRTLNAAEALQAGDLERLGQLMAQSHESMRDDFEITVPKIDELVKIAQSAIGPEGGARMTGGGFGGCVVTIAPKEKIDMVKKAILNTYRTPSGEPPRFIEAAPSAGARLLNL